jgi:hypothetical protein
LSKETFAIDDVLGLIAGHDIELGSGPGDANLNIMGVFFAANEILNEKQNQLAGAMASDYFKINQVPDLFQVPAVVDNLPPGMPGSETINIYTYEIVNGTWREF